MMVIEVVNYLLLALNLMIAAAVTGAMVTRWRIGAPLGMGPAILVAALFLAAMQLRVIYQ